MQNVENCFIAAICYRRRFGMYFWMYCVKYISTRFRYADILYTFWNWLYCKNYYYFLIYVARFPIWCIYFYINLKSFWSFWVILYFECFFLLFFFILFAINFLMEYIFKFSRKLMVILKTLARNAYLMFLSSWLWVVSS